MTENWIRVYDNVIDDEMCDDLIDFFERNPEQHEQVRLEGHRQFAQVNLQMHEEWNAFSDVLTEKFKDYIQTYCEDCNVTNMMFPQQFAFEMYRMKRYLPNGIDEFHDHVDVGDLNSARRFLVFFLYLNEPEGGTTDFPQYNISVKPKKGSMLMFPPMWTHLHAGRKPINKPKYIIGSYLHYV